jgi:hypothetical protein
MMALIGAFRDHPKFADDCFAHDGQGGNDQSGVVLSGRDRSKKAIFKRKRAEERELEEDEEDAAPYDFGTPKVGHSSTFWLNRALTGTRNPVMACWVSLRPLGRRTGVLSVRGLQRRNVWLLRRLLRLSGPVARPKVVEGAVVVDSDSI